jgi:hypothetical protein
MELAAVRARMSKSAAMQARLLELLEREVKEPLAATGTFFDLVEDVGGGPSVDIASRATRQFNQTLIVLDVLLEWARVSQLDRSREWCEADTQRLVRELFAGFKQESCSRRFTLMDRHKGGGYRRLPAAEVSFVLKMLLYWFCEVAVEGEIVVERLALDGGRLRCGLRVQSGLLFSRLGLKVERLVNGKLQPEEKACPTEGFYLALAREVVEEFGGSLRVSMDGGEIEAGFELLLTHG